MWGVAHSVLTPERRVPNISACLWFGRRGHPQMSGWGLISAVSSRALEAWISWWFLFPELYLVSFNRPAWGCRGRQWWLSSCLETMRGTCSGSWFDLWLAKLSGFSSQPGSSNTTQEILMPVTSTTVLGIWQLRDWYGNTIFLSFTPTCYSFRKGCHFRGEMGEVSIKRRKKKKKKKKKLQPSGSLEKNPLTYHVNGYHGLRCAMGIEDGDECDRSLQPGEQACRQVSPVWQKLGQRWWWARRSKEGLFTFPNFKRY